MAVDGTVETRRWQWGRVVTVTDNRFEVVSDDGYRDEYALVTGVADRATITVGQQVTVVGVVGSAQSGSSTEQSASSPAQSGSSTAQSASTIEQSA